MIDFTNKNVLITGGSRGIGRACAKLFSELNANVIFTYKSNHEEAEKTLAMLNDKQNHSMYQLDITKPEAIEEFFREVVDKYQRIDILVNNAGVYVEHKINEVSYLEWQQKWSETLTTNLIGVSNLCYFASRHMSAQKQGKIVNISSRGAFRGEPDHPAYAVSKAGLNAMSQSLAVALGKHNVIVGVIAPGFVETDMAAPYLESEAGDLVKKQSPLNRVATPEEVARIVAVFASDGLEFMTGGIVDLNGASYLRS
ncbi:SDR family NAD(P)-dependent oxidoreductase [Segetibacter aerophilus]|uniref:Beta-ketoacyl-ACP reductase n=1 Tax=Segetibacter aerophilus TaxID=670293 RepID=A0A512BAR8_9BACT|nr:SDR family oxidoreductase [Segetibacter aerophilus]GEO08927.1 beta-ketoacyl-ACP reductase [Segetibacter aerophilus]